MASKLDKLIDRGQAHAEFRAGVEAQTEVEAVGEAVKALRLRRGLSQGDLAKQAGMHGSEVSRLESGTLPRGPTVLTLARIAQACGEKLAVTFGGRDVRVERPSSAKQSDVDAAHDLLVRGGKPFKVQVVRVGDALCIQGSRQAPAKHSVLKTPAGSRLSSKKRAVTRRERSGLEVYLVAGAKNKKKLEQTLRGAKPALARRTSAKPG